MSFYAFVHFSINTFTGREWGNGKENIQIFNPKSLDTDQWCAAIAAAEMKGVVLTAKHHDGFCLWQTKTTNHSVKNTPYKNGSGDIVAELAKSCTKHGLKLGIYLSPWDRNCPLYGSNAYMDFYIDQLTELLTNYGEIFMLWLDGACGASLDGKSPVNYDFERIYKTALSLQPNIILANQGPDVRWVGNERGIARAAEWNVVPDISGMSDGVAQQTDTNLKKFEEEQLSNMLTNVGSRDYLDKFDKFIWRPAEVDVSIRPRWFYTWFNNFRVKSVTKLIKIYINAVGGNNLLILNIPPNKRGLFDRKDISRLNKLGDFIRGTTRLEIAINSATFSGVEKENYPVSNLLSGKTFSPILKSDGRYALEFNFDTCCIMLAQIREDTNFSQRIEEFSLTTKLDTGTHLLYSGETIGFNRLAYFKPITTNNLTLNINKCRLEPFLELFKIYKYDKKLRF
jgi:alpha-L-fucosidase